MKHWTIWKVLRQPTSSPSKHFRIWRASFWIVLTIPPFWRRGVSAGVTHHHRINYVLLLYSLTTITKQNGVKCVIVYLMLTNSRQPPHIWYLLCELFEVLHCSPCRVEHFEHFHWKYFKDKRKWSYLKFRMAHSINIVFGTGISYTGHMAHGRLRKQAKRFDFSIELIINCHMVQLGTRIVSDHFDFSVSPLYHFESHIE